MNRYIDGDELIAWIKDAQRKTVSIVETMPSEDSPTKKWKVIQDQERGLRMNVRCPECRMMFNINKHNERKERTRWKWCPICGTPVKGYEHGRPDKEK